MIVCLGPVSAVHTNTCADVGEDALSNGLMNKGSSALNHQNAVAAFCSPLSGHRRFARSHAGYFAFAYCSGVMALSFPPVNFSICNWRTYGTMSFQLYSDCVVTPRSPASFLFPRDSTLSKYRKAVFDLMPHRLNHALPKSKWGSIMANRLNATVLPHASRN